MLCSAADVAEAYAFLDELGLVDTQVGYHMYTASMSRYNDRLSG
jgi:hypothetical protein